MTNPTITYTDRVLRPWWKKINPIWWFGNDLEPLPPDWYLSGSSFAFRLIAWYLRNPLQNFGRYVLGVMDRNYTATTSMNFSDDKGWGWSVIRLGILRLPFIRYSGCVVVYAGWQTTGFFGFKFNLSGSPVQVV